MIAVLRAGLAGTLLAVLPLGARAEPGPALVDAVPSIVVDGEARRDVTPDLALVTVGVVTDRASAAQAADDNAQAAATLVKTARAAGLGDADIRTSALMLTAVTDGRDASKVRTFRATNQITLRMHDLGKVGALVGQLAAQGANDIGGIAFTVDDPRPIIDALRADAARDAARKADIYAKAVGLKLGRVLRIAPEIASMPIPAPRAYKVQMAVAAPPPVEAGMDTLESRVQITWELLP